LTNEMQETTVVRDELYVLSFENTKTCDILPEIERQTLSSNSGQIMSENGNKEDNDGFTVVSYKKQHVNTKGNGQKKGNSRVVPYGQTQGRGNPRRG
jgi:hypothetical protein